MCFCNLLSIYSYTLFFECLWRFLRVAVLIHHFYSHSLAMIVSDPATFNYKKRGSRYGDQPISLVHNLHFSFPILEVNLGLCSLWSLLSLCFEALNIYFPLVAYFKVPFRTPFAPTRVTNISQALTITLNKWTNEPPQSIKDSCQLRIIFHVLL